MSIPFHDEQLRPPEKRSKYVDQLDPELDLDAKVATKSFFFERDRAFNAFMTLHLIVNFLDKYKIPYPQPYQPDGKINNEFWAMCYMSILMSGAGTPGSKERATLWINVTDNVYANLKTGVYRVNRTSFRLPALLARKTPKSDGPILKFLRQHRQPIPERLQSDGKPDQG